MKYKIGKIIWIKVDSIKRKTIIDPDNVQRFVPEIPLLNEMYENGLIDLNKASITLKPKELSELSRNIGYSVCGWADLSCNENKKIKNPLWK